jgi:predicted  nucleic acid-binding Zn-ribbon protein
MRGETERAEPLLRVVDTVRCLACGSVYSRLREWNSAVSPGCPDCSYVGWQPFSEDAEPLRFHSAADLRQSRFGPRR